MPEGYSLLQSILLSGAFLKNPVKSVSNSMHRFAGTYTAAIGFKRKLILTQDPAFIRHVLQENHKNYQKSPIATEAARYLGYGILFSNGAFWLQQRRLIQPAFHREKLQGLQAVIIETIKESIAKCPIGNAVDLYPFVHGLSFRMLLRSIFDVPLTPDIIAEIGQLFADIQEFLIKDTNQPVRRLWYPVTGEQRTTSRKAHRLRAIIGDIIHQRKSSGESTGDLLDMLLHSTYEDTGERMAEEQIIDEVLILIFAGHETTANTLSWLLYLLANNPPALKQLQSSLIDTSVQDALTNECLKATISEAMRLYPAAWMTERVAIEADRFGPYSFPGGTIIIPFFFGLHRDEQIWENASVFDPERFMPGGKATRSKNYFPFGAGPRMCVGNHFAMTEMCFFVHAFLTEFEIQSTGHTPAMKALITLRPDQVILHSKRKVSNKGSL
ncbi:cytochrome P450 [Niastella sp. MAH-29]|uniref:Cytochrome P450 n=1 Tax=Niastella soli TaxID=2821487 RepID=A0ABS3YYP4_9BACT|nr:cytochrome P450 [Niastella soli]